MRLNNKIINDDTIKVLIIGIIILVIFGIFTKFMKIWNIIVICFILFVVFNYTKRYMVNDNMCSNIFTSELKHVAENICDYEDIYDFVQSIKDLYYYNKEVYIDLINNINFFIDVYEECVNMKTNLSANYTIANDKKREALNNLHSIIFSLPPNDVFTMKLNKSISVLDIILSKYVKKIKDTIDIDLKINGYSVEYNVINDGPLARNIYENEKYTFDIN